MGTFILIWLLMSVAFGAGYCLGAVLTMNRIDDEAAERRSRR